MSEVPDNKIQMRQPDGGPGGAMVKATQTREMAEVQAAVIMAKNFPRNEQAALDGILVACERPSLAEGSMYEYARGGTNITGPSIRLAECIAQKWGNIDFGIRELTQEDGVSEVEAFAWDMETLTRQTKTFQVRHVRHTRQGSKDLTDPRDIYETVANQGARRLRACILGLIPADVVEAAVDQCEKTLVSKAEVTEERIAEMLEKFEEFDVTKEQIEKWLQRRVDTMTPAQMIRLAKIYTSLSDGMSTAGDWFEGAVDPATESAGPRVSQKQMAIDDAKDADCYTPEMEDMRTRQIREAIETAKATPKPSDKPETPQESDNRIAKAATKMVNDEKKAAGEPAADTPPADPAVPAADAPPVEPTAEATAPAEPLPISKACEANLNELVDGLPDGPRDRARAEVGMKADDAYGSLTQEQGVALEALLFTARKEAGL